MQEYFFTGKRLFFSLTCLKKTPIYILVYVFITVHIQLIYVNHRHITGFFHPRLEFPLDITKAKF